jgi:diaminobutyrate-2-oxoglutarate transaminase
MVRSALAAIELRIPGSHLKGRGMFLGIDVGSGELATAICRRAFANGVVLETSGPRSQVVKVLAPLTTPDFLLADGLERVLDAARSVLAEQPELLG